MKAILLILLVLSASLSASAQSGRKRPLGSTAPPAPIQAPLNPEPEVKPKEELSGPLLNVPESFREREIKGLDDTTFKLADFQGKVIVINIWASWCGPCRREVPEYEKVRKAYVSKNVEFIGLTAEDPRTAKAKVNKFVRDVNFTFLIGWIDRETARFLMDGRGAIPQTIVLDSEGRIVNHWSGYTSGQSGNRLRQAIDGALQ